MTNPAAAAIAAWEDEPFGAFLEQQPPVNVPVRRPVPNLDPAGLPVGIAGQRPQPGVYDVGTPEFRYWALADALARSACYWSQILPAGVTWHPDNGPRLIATLDEGVDLNAYYNRDGLHFFHGTVRGLTVFSGESPDIVCHELGHAVLDAVKPQLFDAASIEIAAFHESFADCSAILSNLQIDSLRDEVLAETDSRPVMASRLSRLAESLGWAIRQLIPDASDPGCLRSAVNSFYYQPPATLPPSAPASNLSSEPHNFSRVFTSGFFRVLGGVFAKQAQHDSAGLRTAAVDAGRLLIEGVRRSPVLPGFYAQVAAHMVAADADLFGGRYGQVIRAGFVRSGVLSVRSGAELGSAARLDAAPGLLEQDGDGELPRVPLSADLYGLPADLLVRTAAQARRFGVASGLPDTGDAPASAPDHAAASFVEDLIRRGRIDTGDLDMGDAPITSGTYTTHEIRSADGMLELRRARVDCGLRTH
jgi:hypothetical protein